MEFGPYCDEYLMGIRDELIGIRQALESIAKTLPGGNQEGFHELVKQEVIRVFQSAASSVHTLELYE